jgi:hypothetical protein
MVMEVRIVKVDAFLIVGEMECGVSWGLRNIMKNPRLVLSDPSGALSLSPFIGEPKEIIISSSRMAFGYVREDAAMISRYREAVTGLVLARPSNVVDLRSGK